MSAARILIVEDNPANLALMDYLLRAFGYTPLQARDGEEGVNTAVRERPDLILMDVQLPKLTGSEALKRIRDLDTRAFPIVAVTALAMVGDRERVMAEGFDGYLSKPITPETFVTEVEAFLRPELRVSRSGGAA
jgi:CheY-like chemotaxis protein